MAIANLGSSPISYSVDASFSTLEVTLDNSITGVFIAFVSAGGSASQGLDTNTLTGAGLTWTRQIQSYENNGGSDYSSISEIWTASGTSSNSTNVVWDPAASISGDGMLVVYELSGTDVPGNFIYNSTSAALASSPSYQQITMTGKVANSWLLMTTNLRSSFDYPISAMANTTIDYDTGLLSYTESSLNRLTSPATSGNTTFGLEQDAAGGSSAFWTLAAVEVKEASSGSTFNDSRSELESPSESLGQLLTTTGAQADSETPTDLLGLSQRITSLYSDPESPSDSLGNAHTYWQLSSSIAPLDYLQNIQISSNGYLDTQAHSDTYAEFWKQAEISEDLHVTESLSTILISANTLVEFSTPINVEIPNILYPPGQNPTTPGVPGSSTTASSTVPDFHQDDRIERKIKGVAFPFKKGSLPAQAFDNTLIKMSIQQILLTTRSERLMRPRMGSSLKKFIFDSNNKATHDLLKVDVWSALSNNEKRIRVVDVQVSQDPEIKELVNIYVSYIVLSNQTQDSLTLALGTG